MIIYGSKATHLYSEQVSGIECAHCKQQSKHNISIFGRYAHIFWIPFFPLGKRGVSECTHCKRTLAPKEMNEFLKAAYKKVESTTKAPVWHWIGLALIMLLFFLPMVTSIIMAIFQ